MKQFIKRIFGIEKLEKEKEALQAARDKAVAETVRAQEAEELAKLGPKERATARGESWVAVLDTKVNKDNVRNGFFELDWNEFFLQDLKKAGYGFDEDPEEEIVDRWFRDLARNMLSEEGLDSNRGAGYINVTKLQDGRAQVE
jgi:hypothetical protein